MAWTNGPARRNRRLGLLIIAGLLVLSTTPVYREAAGFPHIVRVPSDAEVKIRFPFPGLLTVRTADATLMLAGSTMEPGQWQSVGSAGLALGASVSPGTATLEVRLLGFIPFRRIEVISVPAVHVVPGGQSIGVLARSDGLLVIEHAPVGTPGGVEVWPARSGGVRVGDILLSADGIRLADADDLAEIVQAAGRRGRTVSLEVRRDEARFQVQVQPEMDAGSGSYLLGLWVRDGAAGVGTLTFWDPDTLVYAALGHEILDPSTGRMLEIDSGVIVEATVWGLNRAEAGQPGEKIGIFSDRSPILGDIQVNSSHGIMGRLDTRLDLEAWEGLPIAMAEDVEVGPAEILTVLSGSNVASYAVTIERVAVQQRPGSRSLIIRVVDGALLEGAGGIVQGMSGSPIIQNGRLVGAVTHVFISDPSRGYGVFAEWMAVESLGVTVPGMARLSGMAGFSRP